ncbi:hypothetical protein ACS0TY_032585 [Phlomoides rotata]
MTLALLTCLYFSLYLHCSNSSPSRPPIGVHPLDTKYYEAELIKCKDGSKPFTRDRLNDNFCDCADGTDEPGTSACPSGRFYCRNTGSTPRFLFSSHVNDQICDCCDGSDEYDGTAICPNTCVMGGNIVYQGIKYDSTARNLDSINSRKTKLGTEMEDSTYKIIGLKALVFLQVALVIIFMAFRLFRRRKTRRRNSR